MDLRVHCSAAYSTRVTNEDFARAVNDAIRRLARTHEGRERLKQVSEALQAHPGAALVRPCSRMQLAVSVACTICLQSVWYLGRASI